MAADPAVRELVLGRWTLAVLDSTASVSRWLADTIGTHDLTDPEVCERLAVACRLMAHDLSELEHRLLAARGLREDS